MSGKTPEVQPGGALPGGGCVAIAHAELLEFKNSALEETQEDLSFALGGRVRNNRRGTTNQDCMRGRVLALKLVTELAAVDSVELDNVLSGPRDWLEAPQLLDALRRQTSDPGQMALMLAGMLARGQPDRRLRRKLEDALVAVIADDDLALSLFGVLEFGQSTLVLRQELRQLYHRASASRQKLSQWLDVLGEGEARQRKLRTMLRVLAYELSASGQPIVGSHLAAVIGDLKQLLRLLGLETHCDRAVEVLALPNLNGERLLRSVVVLVEQIWVNADSVAEMLPPVIPDQRYRLVHALAKLIQLLPVDCFIDHEHKTQLEVAIAELRERSLDS
ncbi:HrpJ domain-containing protein [Burkholderia lata]|uniref:HrpJ domain-containing protein n=1 Tax=Burkholderia lata (strain ATCC 17760 / DSM 23089 / LMG 22485 / NCIMB 9086 / R18194 / 383) TaxID=482957 RepID=UPI001582EF26|nr:HrpJ domain-containing protein [Burkholderia lata]